MSTRVGPIPPRLRRQTDDANGRPVSVLLLHGMGAGVRSWDPLAALLAPHLRLWDVTLPWSVTGDTSWAQQLDVTQWVAAPIEHIRQATGHGPGVVVAHSFAANVTLELLTRSDLHAPTSVVLISPFYRPIGAEIDWASVIPGMKACYSRVTEQLRRKRGPQVSEQVSDAIVRRLLESMGDHAPLRFYDVCRRTPQLNLESLTTPMLLVGGAQDEIGAHADGVRALGERIAHARLEILEDCGHFPMTERAAELAALLETFIEQAAPKSPSVSQEVPQ